MKPEEKEAREKYDSMAEDYHNMRTKEHPKGWFYNEFLEMPATLGLIGNVKRKKLLDLGCGSGIYAKLLTKKGAIVKGFDISPKMLEIAKKNNPDLDLRIGSAYKIPFKEKFDIVYSALVIHYLNDYDKMFKQVSRVLNKNGLFIFSTVNPVIEVIEKINRKYKTDRNKDDYFNEKRISTVWNVGGKEREVFAYHKTYETIIKSIIRNGFDIVDYKDCFPLKKSKKLFPKDYAIFSKIPYFCVWKVRKI